MKRQIQVAVLCLACLSISSFAEEPQKASEMQKPVSEPASKAAKKRAHQQVKESQEALLTKLKNEESPEVIGNAKARVQIDRTESNRQDYLNKEKPKPAETPRSE